MPEAEGGWQTLSSRLMCALLSVGLTCRTREPPFSSEHPSLAGWTWDPGPEPVAGLVGGRYLCWPVSLLVRS